LKTLQSLTGNEGCGADEVAKKDNYAMPYFGKEYDGEAKEVMTMTFEYILGGDKEYFLELYHKDRQLFIMGVGLLAGY